MILGSFLTKLLTLLANKNVRSSKSYCRGFLLLLIEVYFGFRISKFCFCIFEFVLRIYL